MLLCLLHTHDTDFYMILWIIRPLMHNTVVVCIGLYTFTYSVVDWFFPLIKRISGKCPGHGIG